MNEMNEETAFRILTHHNDWRRGKNNDQFSPELIGKAIDVACEVLLLYLVKKSKNEHD